MLAPPDRSGTAKNMSFTPTIRSSQPSAAVWDPAALHRAVERVFEATDVASVVEICEVTLNDFSIDGRLRWQRTGEPAARTATRLDLAEDSRSMRTLVLEWTDPLPEAVRGHLKWLGRLVTLCLQQLAETGRQRDRKSVV